MRRAPNNDLYDFPSEKGKGIIGTVIFHIVLAVILIITGFHTPLPLPEEEGILVNFGTDDTGSGLLEPSVSSSSEPESQYEPEEAVTEDILEESQVEVTETSQEETQLTQDFEEAPVVEKKVDEADEEAERLRQQQIEEERKRIEAEQAAEAERKRLEEEQRRRTEIMNRTRDALERSNARGSDSSGEGITEGSGNQGVETGSVDSKVYDEGSGTGTEGISYNLGDRKAQSLPKPSYDIQSDGIVVVAVTVDRNGNVTKAEPGVQGSTTLEEYFLRVAKEAAMAAKFDSKKDAPVIQKGTITYHFILR